MRFLLFLVVKLFRCIVLTLQIDFIYHHFQFPDSRLIPKHQIMNRVLFQTRLMQPEIHQLLLRAESNSNPSPFKNLRKL
ncbi:uncharacterized protein K441DRAFT_258095 [Cenococcum geophilum 1.58]|uniref:uncharacterized protein n=1 Tax=Cenococcum geophilum 1.58 TaxID=794803 RepID=UPI00358E2764|nr:hypothetical protein K441DRAFT_258095 [Cenococcum geophilum 1.58]